MITLTTGEVKDILERIIQTGIPLRRKREDGQYSYVPPAEFDTYLKNKNINFYLDEESFAKLMSAGRTEPGSKPAEAPEPGLPPGEGPGHDFTDEVFLRSLETIKDMTVEERIRTISDSNKRLRAYTNEGRRFNAEMINETGRIFSESLCINKSTLEENLSAPHPEGQIRQIVTETNELITGLLGLLAGGKTTYRDLAQLEHIETGSVTLDHINRILIRFISFLFFYNAYFQKYSNDIKKFRAHFGEKFGPYYDKVTRGSQQNFLEIVYKDGIGPVTDKATFIDYCMSVMLHDIGKMATIEYHDSGAGYDRIKATRHVFDGYNMLVRAKQYSMSTLSSVLLHHDYFGAPYGYNQLPTFQNRFEDRRKEARNVSVTKYFISYNILDVGYNNALSYFPVKVLEMIDVFDAMTDKHKKYRAGSLSSEEALKEMRYRFIEGAHLGIDPILYNIFIDFNFTSGIVTDREAVEFLKI